MLSTTMHMRLKLVNNLVRHPFIKLSLKDVNPLIMKDYPEIAKRSLEWDWLSKIGLELDDADWYRYEVFMKQTAIFSVLDKVEYAYAFIQNFPSPRTYEKKFEITQYIWFEYHFQCFVFSIVSLFDCLLILTNSVFRIGLKDSHCKRNPIIDNYWIKQTGFDSLLKDFEKIATRYTDIRNLHLHRGKGKSVAEVINSDTLAFLRTVSFLQLHDEHVFPKKTIELGFKVEINEVLNLIETESAEIETNLEKIFSALEKQYLIRRSKKMSG